MLIATAITSEISNNVNNEHNNREQESNRSTSTMNVLSGTGVQFFPPCTSDDCPVGEEEKQRVTEEAAANSKNNNRCELTEKCVQSCAAYGRICPCVARTAAHYACKAIQELKKDSLVFPQVAEDEDDNGKSKNGSDRGKPSFCYLNSDDIVIGKKLGEGGFSNVNLCTIKKGDEAGSVFAVKYLKKRAMVDLHQFKHGAADLAVEAHFLHALFHPNIVQLHGVTAGSVETNVASGKECGFFIVVDRLVETLEERLERWRDENEFNGGGRLMLRLTSEYKNKKKAELHSRIQIAMDIAKAMDYLHSLHIVFRDCKPDNIGFDENGVLKLFDFGLAKELKPGLEVLEGKYKLTGNTGSRRYMSPEVAKELPYDLTVDVYSFGILLWELCSARKPFYGYSSARHMQQVVIGGERPKMDSHHTAHWPANLQMLMTRCWSPTSSLRPSFKIIIEVLQDILDGKEAIPPSLLTDASGQVSSAFPTQPVPGGNNALGTLFQPLSRRKVRSKTCESASPPPPSKEALKGLMPTKNGSSNNNNRSRSWGFGGLRR